MRTNVLVRQLYAHLHLVLPLIQRSRCSAATSGVRSLLAREVSRSNHRNEDPIHVFEDDGCVAYLDGLRAALPEATCCASVSASRATGTQAGYPGRDQGSLHDGWKGSPQDRHQHRLQRCTRLASVHRPKLTDTLASDADSVTLPSRLDGGPSRLVVMGVVMRSPSYRCRAADCL